MKTRSFKLLSLVMVISMLVPAVVVAQTPATATRVVDEIPNLQVEEATAVPMTGHVVGEIKGATGPAIYMVQLRAAPLASYRGGVAGLEATHPATRGMAKLDAKSPASVAYLEYLSAEQAKFTSQMEQSLGRAVDVKFTYQATFNGLAVELTPEEAARVAGMSGVRMVQRDYMLYPTTDAGPQWIGAPAIWDGTATGGLPGTKGEGIVVGILDTGINIDHASFAAVGPIDGYVHTNPFPGYLGWCDPGNPNYDATLVCNDKLVGVWDFVDAVSTETDGTDDHHGHGSHTASTTAGNVVTATINAPTMVLERVISGVAPHANIIAYDVCYTGGCPNSATTAAANQAVLDGVDVINYSIGGGPADPWQDAGSQNWLGVRDAGVFVATSAGNDGPNPETMGSPGNSPWMLVVGSTTHNRQFINRLIDMNDGGPKAAQPEALPKPVEGKPERLGPTAPREAGALLDSELFANVVTDGGFEAGPFGGTWYEFSSNFGTPICDVGSCGTGGGTGPHSGTYWTWFGGTSVAETGYVTQTVTIPSTATNLTFWLEIPASGTTGFMNVSIDGNVVFGVTEADAATYATYQQVVVDISAYADDAAHNLSFDSTTDAGAGATNFFIDDVVIDDGTAAPPADMAGAGITSGYGPAPIVYAGDYPNPNDPGGDPAQCMEPYPAGTFSGQIVLCDRGTIARVAKGANVLAGGAGGLVLANTAADGESIVADAHYLPAVHVGFTNGELLRAWLATVGTHNATIEGMTVSLDPANGDIMAASSSRGPNPDYTNAASIIRPDVTAPGVSVLAASKNGIEYESMSGTSMASPHAAGAAALVWALHPMWDASEVQSALMSTAWTDVLNHDGVNPADPFAMGAGRVDLNKAAEAGFVLGETTTNFQDANPATGGDPAQLNLASLANGQCLQNCTWSRTLQSSLSYSVTWTATADVAAGMVVTITPDVFTLLPGGSQEIIIEADVTGLTNDVWAFGEILFTPAAPSAPPTAAPSGMATYTDTTVGGPEWDRPVGGTCTISGLGPVRYHEQAFQVSLGDTYVISSVQDYDGYLHLYENAFDPLDQCTGLLAGDDDGPSGIGSSEISYALLPGTTYYAVTSGFAAGDEGVLTNTISGGGDVMLVTPLDVPAAHFPLAVRPSAGVLPQSVEINTRRDAGSYLIEGLETMEAPDLTLTAYGFVEADLHMADLLQIPDNGIGFPDIYFQDLGAAQLVTLTVPAGTMRLVAEVLDTTSPDLDMLLFFDADDDGVPELSDTVGYPDYCQSAAGGPWEYCSIMSPPDGTWFAIVINFTSSTVGGSDLVELGTGVVFMDEGNMSFGAPASVPALTPFDVRLFWDIPTLMAGDHWYGAFGLGTTAGTPDDIGVIPVNLIRHEDDVVKTVNSPTANPGDTLTYTITVAPNVTMQDLTYYLTDTIPAGLTYVPASAMATAGTVNVVGDTVYWTGTMYSAAASGSTYEVSTSATDPSCVAPLANSGAYVNLQGYGLTSNPGISGDGVWYTVNFSGGAHSFFGEYQGEIVNFTDDGFVFFDPSTPGATPGTHQPIPTAGAPDNLMAIFWRDFEIVYDGPTNRGVSLANLTTGGVPSGAVIEYDDVQDNVYGGTYDFEVILRYDESPTWYEYIFAYDNLNGGVVTGTIGLENAAGTFGIEYAYDDIAVTNGMAVCFDAVPITLDPVTITFQVTVDADASGVITNTVYHNTDDPGSVEAMALVDVTVGFKVYLPVVLRNHTP